MTTDAENSEKGVFVEGRTVKLSAFEIGKYEVTQKLYKAVMTGQKVTVDGTEHELNATPSHFKVDNLPVETVEWYNTVYFCNELSEKVGLTPAYDITVTGVSGDGSISKAEVKLKEDANGYRLPTEAEWEYAARGGKPAADAWEYKYAGTNEESSLKDYAWYKSNSEETYEVGKKKANSFGIHDMSGSVYEWCWDWYDIPIKPDTPYTGVMEGYQRVLRGGGWSYDASICRVSYRNNHPPDESNNRIGFRVVRPAGTAEESQ